MSYKEKIQALINKVPKTLVDLDIPREQARVQHRHPQILLLTENKVIGQKA